MTRVAAVDLGTNSTRLLVADVHDGRVDEIERRLRITRLGEGLGERRRLLPVPIARVRNCLSEYRTAIEQHGAERTLVVATSAVRDAENGEAFLGEIEWSYGFATRLLSGEDEGLLTLRGVSAGRLVGPGTLIVDVGGGSTELLAGGPDGITFQASFDLGCVRTTEQFLPSDPPTPRELVECAAAVRAVLAEQVPADAQSGIRDAIGVAGTVTTLAALDLGLREYDPAWIHGHRIPADAVEFQLHRLAALSLAERRELQGLDPERAPVIVAGIVIVDEILRYFGLGEIEASEQDLLHGAALAAAELPARSEGDVPPGAYTCC